jgi:hypothetical protein
MDARPTEARFREILEAPPLAPELVASRRLRIAERIVEASSHLAEADFSAISTADLFELLRGYDELFFNRIIAARFPTAASGLRLRLSRRMTSTGGTTTMRPRRNGLIRQHDFEIAISATVLFNTRFAEAPLRVAGVQVYNRLDALQRIFEHELLHLFEMLGWEHSSCARRRFRTAAWNWFGHTESKHELLTSVEVAQRELALQPGDLVRFRLRGQAVRGRIERITRRATVLVAQPSPGAGRSATRYVRYYVPLGCLSKCPGSGG